MNASNELTSESDWDSSWEAFEPEAIKDNDQILGKNCTQQFNQFL